jgi:hypothetical protein
MVNFFMAKQMPEVEWVRALQDFPMADEFGQGK